jgi:aspartyl-tRNA(Asn)/glutamyl-tRNA(Gln) amidotransferase subunit A
LAGTHDRAAQDVATQQVRAERVGQRRRIQRQYFKKAVAEVMADLDVLVTPTSTTPAEKISEMDMERRMLGASFTGMWNLIGLPALAMPCGFSSTELPLSMQIVGKPFDETSVLRIADAFQQLTDWHLQVPPIATRTLEPVGVQ